MVINSERDSEKRAQVRVPVNDEIGVRDTVNGGDLGTLANLHSDGFMLISDGGLKEDHLYQVVFEMEPGNAAADIAMGAECLWISETGTGDQVWAGFQIMEMSDDVRQRLDELMEQYQE